MKVLICLLSLVMLSQAQLPAWIKVSEVLGAGKLLLQEGQQVVSIYGLWAGVEESNPSEIVPAVVETVDFILGVAEIVETATGKGSEMTIVQEVRTLLGYDSGSNEPWLQVSSDGKIILDVAKTTLDVTEEVMCIASSMIHYEEFGGIENITWCTAELVKSIGSLFEPTNEMIYNLN